MTLLQIAVPNEFLEPLSRCILLICAGDLSTAHILVSANAKFDEANGYAALQSSDTLMVEVDGEWK